MEEQLKREIDLLFSSIENFNENVKRNEESAISEKCPMLKEARQTFKEFTEETIANLERMLQLRDMNSTVDITMDNISFLNESRIETKPTDKYLTVDWRNERFNELIRHNSDANIDFQKLNKFVELDRQSLYQKFNDKLTRKANRLECALSLMDTLPEWVLSIGELTIVNTLNRFLINVRIYTGKWTLMYN